MIPKIGDVFELESIAPDGQFHIRIEVTELPRGRVYIKALTVLKMDYHNHKVGDVWSLPKSALFGKGDGKWYNTIRLPKSKYPEYYL